MDGGVWRGGSLLQRRRDLGNMTSDPSARRPSALTLLTPCMHDVSLLAASRLISHVNCELSAFGFQHLAPENLMRSHSTLP